VTFDVTVLGCSGSHTGPGRACSGYLVRADGAQLLVDCGNGSTANLQRVTRPEDLDAILITHRHVDHCVDLIGMFYALRFHPKGPQPIELYAARRSWRP
jgi:ribonuclease BN (tRNA processing enzyme)